MKNFGALKKTTMLEQKILIGLVENTLPEHSIGWPQADFNVILDAYCACRAFRVCKASSTGCPFAQYSPNTIYK